VGDRDNEVGRFTPANPVAADDTTIAAIGSPRGITLGPDGNLWAVSDGNVIKIPPGAPNTAVPTAGLITGARQVVPGSGNTLWATGGDQVIHFTTAPAQAPGSPYTVGGGPMGIASGPGGQIAYGNPLTSPQTLGRITPPGAPQLTNLANVDAGFGMTFANDGAYWFGQFNGKRLGRLTPQGGYTTLGGISNVSNRGPRMITTGPGNTLWVTLESPGDMVPEKVARVTGVAPPTPTQACTANDFVLGDVHKNKKKGTAEQTVLVPCPGEVVLEGKKVKEVTEQAVATAAGAAAPEIEVVLKVTAKGKAKRKLKKKGKARVKFEVTYTPTGGEPTTKSKKLKLKKRR
jgi:streptogramin lyase